jgi:hypothetical protein
VTGADPVAEEVGGTPKNRAGIIFPSQSRTNGTYNSAALYNPNAKGVRLTVANDAAGGSTATAKIQVLNPADGVTWVDLAGATSAAVGSSTGTITTIYPGLTGIADAAGVTINQHLGSVWRVVLTTTVGAAVASVGADYLL